MNKKILLSLSGVALLGSLLTFGVFKYKASNTQDFEHSDFKIVEVVKNEKYQQLSYFFSGSFPIDTTKLDMNNQEDVDFVNNIPAMKQTNDITTVYSEEPDETKGSLFSEIKNQQLGYYEQSLDGTGKYCAVFYDKASEYDLYLIKDSKVSIVENNNIDSSLLDYYFYEIDGNYYPYLDIIGLKDDEQYVLKFEKYAEDSKIDANNSWNFVPAYSGNIYSQNEDKTYTLKESVKTNNFDTYETASVKPIVKISSQKSDEVEKETESTSKSINKVRGSISVYEYISANNINFVFSSIFSQKYTNPTVRVINYDALTVADIEDADLIYFNTNSEDTFYSKEYEKYNKSTDTLSSIDVFTSDIDKKIIDKMYDNKLIILWGSEFRTNALQHEKLSKTDLIYVLTNNTYASIIKNGKLNDDKTLYDYLDSYDGSLKELYSSVPTFTSAEDIASAETLQRFNIVNTDLAYNICLHGILDLPSDDLITNWGSPIIEKNELNEKAVGDASNISLEAGVLYLLNEDRASGLGSNARLLEIEPCDDYTDTNYWNWRMFGIAPYFTGNVTVEQMNIDEFICKNTDLLTDYDIIFIGSNYNITKQGGMPYSQWVVDDTVKRYSTSANYLKVGDLNTTAEVALSELYRGDDLNITGITVKASDHTHESWRGNCDSPNLQEITVSYSNNKFTLQANTVGNYIITLTTDKNIDLSFTYLVLNELDYKAPATSDTLSNKSNWLLKTSLNDNGSFLKSDNLYNFATTDSAYKLNFNNIKHFRLSTNNSVQPKAWYVQYYDENMKVLNKVTSSTGIFDYNADATYARFILDYGNISADAFNAYDFDINISTTSDDIKWFEVTGDEGGYLVKYVLFDSANSVALGLSEYGFSNIMLMNTLPSDFNVSVDSSKLIITYTGDSSNFSEQLKIKSGDTTGVLYLRKYDTELKWSNKGGFPTRFNDSNLNGKIYYHVGDLTNGLTNTSTNYLGAVDDNVVSYDPNRTTRLSGNDLTKKMYVKLVEYVNSGRALIVSDQLYNADGTLNESGVDTSSYVYKLISEYSDKVLNDKKSVNFDFSYLDEDSFSLSFEEVPLVYRDYTLFNFDDTTRTAKFDYSLYKKGLSWSSEGDIKFDYNSEDGGKTEYTYDELGISSSSEASTAFYLNKNDKSLKQVEMRFKINTTSSYRGTYNAKFYSDMVSDGIFDESERIDFYSIKDEDGNSYNSNNLVAGKTYTVKINLDDDFSGCLHWKLLVTRGNSDRIRGSFESYCAFIPTERTRLDILQITPYGAGGKTWSSGDLTNYPAFMKLVEANQDYDIHIISKTAEEFNTFDFNTLLVDEDDIKKTFAQLDMVIVGFGDWADYIWSDSALQAMSQFVGSGRAVLFTHDTSSFINSDDEKLMIKDVDYNSDPKKLKCYYINRYFRNVLGQDKYGVTLRDSLNSNDSKITQENAGKADVKILGAQSDSFLSEARSNGKDLAYTLDSKQSFTYYDIDGLTDYLYTSSDLASPNIGSASCVNRGQIVSYPYYIPDSINIEPTHPQYYQLDLEDPNLTVWYSLNHSCANSKAGQNYYYIYSRKNITYSGVGHGQLESNIPTFEWKLYLNTMIMAYRYANSAYLACTDDYYSEFDNVVQVFSDYALNNESTSSGISDLEAINSDTETIKFTVKGTSSVAGTDDRLYIVGTVEDSDSFESNTRDLCNQYDIGYNENIHFLKQDVYNPDIYFKSTLADVSSDSDLKLYKVSEDGISQLLDTVIIRHTRRTLYNIR